MTRRLKFNCWNCKEDYSLFLELEGKPKLSPECPYCGSIGIVELDPYRQDVVKVLRSDSAEKTVIGTEFNFPDVVPTHPPE